MKRGLGSMSSDRVRVICRLGGKAAHEKGTAHEWTPEEAKAAGRKGGMTTQQRKRAHIAELGSMGYKEP